MTKADQSDKITVRGLGPVQGSPCRLSIKDQGLVSEDS
jgi:hypothetical protein